MLTDKPSEHGCVQSDVTLSESSAGLSGCCFSYSGVCGLRWSKMNGVSDGTRGETPGAWESVSTRVCVRAEWSRAWAPLVTRASFIMSDDINHKADRAKWRNRYRADPSPVIRGRYWKTERRREGDRMRSLSQRFTHLAAFSVSSLIENLPPPWLLNCSLPLSSPPLLLYCHQLLFQSLFTSWK